MRGCEWCDYKENEWLLYQSLYWSVYLADRQDYVGRCIRFLYKGIIINHNKKLSQPTLKRRFFKKKAAFFSWPGLGKEWC